jgi:acetyl esterase/lipase
VSPTHASQDMNCSHDHLPNRRAGRAVAVVLAVAFAAVLLAGCRPLTVVNVLSPSAHYERHADHAYGDAPRQRLDLYRPVDEAPDAPVVVFFYGNGWREASKADFEFVAASLTRAGIIVVIPDYRAHPEFSFPAFVEDGARAVEWASRTVAVTEGNRPLFLMGHSAGAQIAALLALDERYLDAVGAPPIAGFIGLSGPYDFLPLDPGYMEEVFPEDTRAASQPIAFVSARAPRTLLIHGTSDRRVLPEHSERLAAALEAEGVPVTLKFYDGVGHGRVVAALAPPLQFIADTMGDLVVFIETE